MTEYPKRRPFCIPIEGYRHMRRSLIRFCGVDELDVVPLLYPLYIGNLDTCQYSDVPLTMMELSEDGFWSVIAPWARPYHTELQMHRSMIGLLSNIYRDATIQRTRDAMRQFYCLIENLENRFRAAYDCEINDPRTQYNRCWCRLTVRDSEPLTVFKTPCSARAKNHH